MNCEPKNERYMLYKIEPPPVNASAQCVINGTEKCGVGAWWEADDWNYDVLRPERRRIEKKEARE